MKSQKSVGLVCAGGVNQSFLARMPALLGKLGPIKGSSLHVSRRIANRFKAGFGVSAFQQLDPCSMILLCAPDGLLDSICRQLAASLPLKNRNVVICDSTSGSDSAHVIRASGGLVATLNCVPDSDERVFVAEGSSKAIAAIKKLLDQDRRKLIELHPGKKSLYLSGVLIGTQLVFPWIEAAVEIFRAAGFTRNEATLAVQAMGTRALRAYTKAGSKAQDRSTGQSLHDAIRPEMEILVRANRHIAGLHRLFAVEFGEIPGMAKAKPAQPDTGQRPVLFKVEAAG